MWHKIIKIRNLLKKGKNSRKNLIGFKVKLKNLIIQFYLKYQHSSVFLITFFWHDWWHAKQLPKLNLLEKLDQNTSKSFFYKFLSKFFQQIFSFFLDKNRQVFSIKMMIFRQFLNSIPTLKFHFFATPNSTKLSENSLMCQKMICDVQGLQTD